MIYDKGQYEDLQRTEIENLRNQLAEAQRVIEFHRVIEGKAHALFTEAFSNGVRLAHYPEQCNPLGFVQVMRSAIEKLLKGEQLPKPFIHKP